MPAHRLELSLIALTDANLRSDPSSYEPGSDTVNSLIKAQGAEARQWLNRGHFQLPKTFYRMQIGPFLAEIWPKT